MIPPTEQRNTKHHKDKTSINDRLAQHLPYKLLSCDLAAVVDAWPSLPEPIRAGILAMGRAAERDPGVRVRKEGK
jgi:hypothetical protein